MAKGLKLCEFEKGRITETKKSNAISIERYQRKSDVSRQQKPTI